MSSINNPSNNPALVTPIRAAASAPEPPLLTPTGSPGPIDFDSTLIGHHPVTHLPATVQRPNGTPHAGMSLVTPPPAIGPVTPVPRATATPFAAAPRSSAPIVTPPSSSPLGTTPPINVQHAAVPPAAAPAGPAPVSPTPTNSSLGTPRVPSTNLRAAYPKIHLQPPSPTRPLPSMFDDRPSSSVDVVGPYVTPGALRRKVAVRRVALVIGLVLSFMIGLLLASQL
jgi:hypothetical protein